MRQKIIFCGIFLLIISGLSITTVAQPPASQFLENSALPICGTPYIAQKNITISDTVRHATNKFYKKYQSKLDQITAHYQELGFNITPMLKDSRFKIYEGIDERFIGSAENTTPTLAEYKEILEFNEKAAKIDNFIDQHIAAFNQAESQYGISKYIIAAVLGIESNFGKNIGSHDPFNVYISMMVVDYRADFARAQLKHLLMFVERENIDVHTLKSSYAGAMSYAQFIPYSVNKWWVGDELFNMKNNILSIANYLAYFKERTDDKATMIMRYNPSSLYTNIILDLAEAARENYK